jgi:hypothetical protein
LHPICILLLLLLLLLQFLILLLLLLLLLLLHVMSRTPALPLLLPQASPLKPILLLRLPCKVPLLPFPPTLLMVWPYTAVLVTPTLHTPCTFYPTQVHASREGTSCCDTCI